MTPIQHLKQLIIEEYRRKYHNTPEHCLPKPNTGEGKRPEAKELHRIKLMIQLSGGIASITNASAVRVDNRHHYIDGVGFARTIGSIEYRKSGIDPGTSDISATYNGTALYIELKRKYKSGQDRQSPIQRAFQERVEAAGGVYWIVSSFEDFYEKFIIFAS